jgi:CBS domain-containing protein
MLGTGFEPGIGRAKRREGSMKVDALLSRKNPRIISIRISETAGAAARLLRSENIGAVVVKDTCGTEGDVVVGVLSERDILRTVLDHGIAAWKMPVETLMARAVVSCKPTDEIEHVAELMEQHHIRHVPVIDREALVGVISIRDLLAQRAHLRPEAMAAA